MGKDVESAVRACYSTWSQDYHERYFGPQASYPPVHLNLIKRELLRFGARSVLDAGCGPASMLRELTGLGLTLHGFDLTPEMVAEARRVLADLGLPPSTVWEGSVLDPAAFRLPPEAGSQKPDAVVCCGVLPHIPEDQEDSAIRNLMSSVRPGGLVVLEARNALFALFTLNRYSHGFFLEELCQAPQLRRLAGETLPALDDCLDGLAGMFRTDLPPKRQGTTQSPGYDEILSRGHNPLVLKAKLEQAGLREVRPLFYHFHCLPPMFEASLPAFFRENSLRMEDPEDWRGYFMASAFLMTGTTP